jgi:hypothetical protein
VKLVLEPTGEGNAALSGRGVGKGDEPGGLSTPVIAAGIGVAAAGLVMGGLFAGLSNGARSDSIAMFQEFETDPGACNRPENAAACEKLYGAYSDTAAFKHVAITGFVVGGTAAIATGLYVLLTGGVRSSVTSREENAANGQGIQMALGVSSSGGAVSFRGKF